MTAKKQACPAHEAARASGHHAATRAAITVLPPSDGEVDGIGMYTKCATAYHKTKRRGAKLARGESGFEIV